MTVKSMTKRNVRNRLLTDDQVREIRLAYHVGDKSRSYRSMAKDFGVSPGVIAAIVKRTTYKGIEPDLAGVTSIRPPHPDSIESLDWIEWIESYEQIYAVTDDGRIASYHRAPIWMQPSTGDGYRLVALHTDAVRHNVLVGRLVYAAFGDKPMVWGDPTWCVHRKDGNTLNDRIENLELMPVADLYPAREIRGTDINGERHHNAKLTQKQVDEIRDALRTTDVMQRDLAKKYGVAESTISSIHVGENWAKCSKQ